MARSPRLFLPGAVYHVYCRTARGEMVFSEDLEAAKFVHTVADVKRLHGFRVLAWCLMGNHYHVVIRTSETALWRSMARIQCRVARGHNRRRRVLGRLWQSRYKARVVRGNAYFKQVLAYVHLNPVAAGLVDDPATYRWSGHAELIGKRPPELVDHDAALRGFGETTAAARADYLDQVRAVAEARWLENGVRHLPWWENVSNDDQLVESKDADSAVDYRGEPIPFSQDKRIGLDQAATLVCRAAGYTVDDLRNRSRSAGIAIARRAFAILAVHHLGYSVADVALRLQKHPGSVSRWLETSGCTRGNASSVSAILSLIAAYEAHSATM